MFSKSQIKFINSLRLKKNRQKQRLFVAEGKKTISELLKSSLELYALYTIKDIFDIQESLKTLITEEELKKVSSLTTPQTALAIFRIPEPKPVTEKSLILAVDEVQDPGNLGTIIRMCDWFDIKDLVCSKGTVDCYNSKVVQASMGSIARVNVLYEDLPEFLRLQKNPIFGAFLEGENVYSADLPLEGVLIMGNEANGITEKVGGLVTQKLNIPQFGELQETESLNVATATAIFLSEFRRRIFIEK